jgi:hypothetical protein
MSMTSNSAKVALPYLSTPGSLKTALDKIKLAATPDRVTRDFVSTKLQMKGGTGAAMIPFLKKVGFVGSDGAPTDIYNRFRNHTTAGSAAADAVKVGYAPLSQANEYFYDLNDKDLAALVVQVTGAGQGDQVAKLTVSTLKMLKAYADFEGKGADEKTADESQNRSADAPSGTKEDRPKKLVDGHVRLGLSYTINLNLPATADQAVFNAIFRSLKEHLLSDE